jgi:hypothetical protein
LVYVDPISETPSAWPTAGRMFHPEGGMIIWLELRMSTAWHMSIFVKSQVESIYVVKVPHSSPSISSGIGVALSHYLVRFWPRKVPLNISGVRRWIRVLTGHRSKSLFSPKNRRERWTFEGSGVRLNRGRSPHPQKGPMFGWRSNDGNLLHDRCPVESGGLCDAGCVPIHQAVQDDRARIELGLIR